MKITKAQLRKLITEEVNAYVNENNNDTLVNYIIEYRSTWLNRYWTDEAIKSDLKGAYSELMIAVSASYNKSIVDQWYTGQEKALAKARRIMKIIVRDAQEGKLRVAVKTIERAVPRTKSPSAIAETPLGREVGLREPRDVAPPVDDDDDL